ncbi:hypothetical protein HPB48_009103 [Haemaphysalis longicornis]|uniref:DDE Tnp4 domain-containing protein n=1 Tax=Haemaphysalis longicornis TaxID=44386 RepID=A0A9J6G7P6_HAELO|nr:hypothetical protein HPB48_009103 [Haemaphysalis longicornis]
MWFNEIIKVYISVMWYRYNKAQIITRNSIERAFGVWKRTFPCLRMTLQIKTKTVPVVVTACATLYNLSRQMNEPCADEADNHIGSSRDQPAPAVDEGQDARLDGYRRRALLIEEYFS